MQKTVNGFSAFDLGKFQEETKRRGDGWSETSSLTPEQARAMGVEVPGESAPLFSPIERKLGILIPRNSAERDLVDRVQAERLFLAVASFTLAAALLIAWAVIS